MCSNARLARRSFPVDTCMISCNLLRRLRACTGVLSANKLQHLFMLMMVMKVIFHMGHYSMYFDFLRITSSSRSSGDGRSMVYFTLDEKLNLQCIDYYSCICVGVNVLVNVTSNHSKYEALIYCSGNVTYNHIYQHIYTTFD